MITAALCHHISLKYSHSWLRLFTLFLTATLGVSAASAQTQTTSVMPLQDRIAQEVKQIESAAGQHLTDEQLGYLWARLASDYGKADDFSAAEGAYIKALHLLEHTPSARVNYATALDNLGLLYLSFGRLDESEIYGKKALAIRRELGNSIDIARSEQHLAEIALARHRFKDAESEASHAFQTMVDLKDPDRRDLVSALNTLTFARCTQGKCAEGRQNAEQALSIARTAFGPDSLPAAHALMAVGFANWKRGENKEAEQAMLAAMQIMKTHLAPGSPAMLLALIEYRNYLNAMHRVEAKEVDAQLAMSARQRTPSCGGCSVSVYSLSHAMR